MTGTTTEQCVVGWKLRWRICGEAKLGLFSFGSERGGPEQGDAAALNLCEGMARIHRRSRCAMGMVFELFGAVYVVTDYHDDPGECILCFCRPEVWRPMREVLEIDVLGMISPVPKEKDVLLSALADFGTPASSTRRA